VDVEAFTVGVEEEFLVVDVDTMALRPDAGRVLAAASEQVGGQAQAELLADQIEIETTVCHTLEEVRADLTRLRRQVAGAAEAQGRCIMASGTHPFSTFEGQRTTPKERYLALEHDFQQLAREQHICGSHVHVGVADRDVAVRVMDRTRPWLAVLRALCTNSPFWQGADTGYASYRTEAFDRWPTTGAPAPLGSRAAFDSLLEALLATGVMRDAGALYWDIRPSARYDTLELRVADVGTSVDEDVMLAGLFRSLVRRCHADVEAGVPVDHAHPEVVRLARWRAARDGLEGTLVELPSGRPVPARVAVERLLDELRSDLEAHGEWEEVAELVSRQLAQGSGAHRQREVAEAAGLRALAADLAARTLS
jgi:carboxylate-amine ligase